MVIHSLFRRLTLSGLIILFSLSGCSLFQSGTGWYKPLAIQMQNDQAQNVVQTIESAKKNGMYDHKDRFLYYLDSGLAYHYAQEPDSSIRRLHLAEQAAEDLFTKSVSRDAMSWLLNDNVLEYPGEDYEILYSNLFKALDFSGKGQWESAMVEIRRADLKLAMLEQKYAGLVNELNRNTDQKSNSSIAYHVDKIQFHNDALARYLSMHFYAAAGDPDNARVDYDKLKLAFENQPMIYNFPMPKVIYQPSPGQTILSVIALSGLSPVKEKFDLRIRGDKTLNLIQILYTDTHQQDPFYTHIPMLLNHDFYAKLSIPRVVERPSDISSIWVYTDTGLLGQLQVLEDVYQVAQETFKARKSLIYLRSVARVVAKTIAGYQLKKKVDNPHFDGWLKKILVDVYTDLSEGADIRCCHLLPGKIWVGDFELTPGEYHLRIEFLDRNQRLLSAKEFDHYRIKPGQMNLVEAASFR